MRGCRRLVLLAALLAGGCGKESTAQLIDNLKAPETQTRIIAVRTLQARKAEAAAVVPALTETLKDVNGEVRKAAAWALGTFGAEAKSAIPFLQAALRDREPHVRKAAALALFRIDPRFPDPSKPRPARGK